MATEQALKCISVPASGDLSASQYCAMKIDTNGQLAVAGEGADVAGILQDAPAAAGRAGSLAVAGVTKMRAGGVVSKGDKVSPDSTGRATTVGSSDDYAYGIALEASTAADQVISVLIRPIGKS